MKQSNESRLAGTLLSLICILLLAVVSIDERAVGNPSAANSHVEPKPANSRLRRLIDFDQFKSIYKRSYATKLEELVRMRVFLARSVRACLSAVAYKFRLAKYWLAINGRSDRLDRELRASEQSRESSEEQIARLVGESNAHLVALNISDSPLLGGDEGLREADASQPTDSASRLVNNDLIEDELKQVKDQVSSQVYQQLTNELDKIRRTESSSRGGRSKRSLARKTCLADSRASFNVEESVFRGLDSTGGEHAANDFNTKVKRGRLVQSNNPRYSPPELLSFGAGNSPDSLASVASNHLAEEDLRQIYLGQVDLRADKMSPTFGNLPVKSQHSTLSRKRTEWRKSGEFEQNLASSEPAEQQGFRLQHLARGLLDGLNELFGKDDEGCAPGKPDVVWVDHTRSGCLNEIQEQGACASCYIFAVNAFLEWLYCKQTDSLVKFSEQYALDCGERFLGAAKLAGCRGGHSFAVAQFAANFGLELAHTWPYSGNQNECAHRAASLDLGFLRPQISSMVVVPARYFEHYVQFAPIVINIATRGDFFEYAGGVHDGKSCGQLGSHSVLLVGHGREDGEEFWLIRNSHSREFGESGHYKLNKNSDCIHPQVGFVFATSDGVAFEELIPAAPTDGRGSHPGQVSR